MAQTKCLFLTGSFILLLAAGRVRGQTTPTPTPTTTVPPRDYGLFSGASVVLLPSSTWDLRLSKELTFRTCSSQGVLLSQRTSASPSSSLASSPSSGGVFRGFKLYLLAGALVFEWSRVGSNGSDVSSGSSAAPAPEEVRSVAVGSNLTDNRQYTVTLKAALGNLDLTVTGVSPAGSRSVRVANATYNRDLLSAVLGPSDLVVGEGFVGCLYAGPGVSFRTPSLVAENVTWNTCPLQAAFGCSPADHNDCFSEPCFNGGVCVDLFQMYRCDCPSNFNGTNCEVDLTLTYGCNVSPCINGGTCNRLANVSSGARPYNCTCPAGYSGYNCEKLLNFCQTSPQPCNLGQCLSGINTFTCNCTGTGFTGANCSEDINECNQGEPCGIGTCFNLPGNYSCACPLGFDGKPCQAENLCRSSPCQNGATCTPGLNIYNCSCPSGFSGSNCETNIDDCERVRCSGQFERCVDKVNSYDCVCLDGYRKNVTRNVCTEINECESRPCQNGATCSDKINGYSCTCLPGYNGTNCQANTDDCASGPCLNNATCVDSINAYTCLCKVGFTSSNCSVNIDDCKSNPCRNTATCIDLVNDYKCNCNVGWTGRYCDESVNECASNPCQNDGRCNDRVAGYSCICPPGYSGVNCENNTNECQPNPCMNGATCQDLLNDYNCVCPTQYMGKNCTEPYNVCSFKPCKNNGSCEVTDRLQRNYTCTCLSGFTGRDCETNINDCEGVQCPVYQVCHDGINNHTCGCPIGFEGPTCSQNINECASNPCLNGGVCYDGLGFYNCTCPKLEGSRLASYTGVNCEKDVDECAVFPPTCEHGGDCYNQYGSYRCRCWGETEDGNYLITGKNCDTLTTYCEVNRFPCQNGGTCRNGVGTYHCDCRSGFTDKNCSTNINECLSSPCRYNGTCIDGINGYNCTCIPGITGANCEIDIDECSSNPCHNGTCIDHINGFECNCTDTGFNGTVCDNNIDDCIPDICQHNGTCLDGIKEYSCSCLRGYTGRHCETDVKECASGPCQFSGTCLERSDSLLYGRGLPGFNDTFSYATAAGYVCQCIPGITGLNCEIDIDECGSSPCMNGGTCSDWINGYNCSCAPGYTDTWCEREINECDLYRPCQNGAKCTDLVANYTCTCLDFVRYNNNYGGRNCTVRLSGCDGGSGCKNGYCVPMLESESPVRHGYYCQCNPGFTGKFCDLATTISFGSNGTSVSYNVSAASMTRQQVAFRFRTTLQDAVLLLTALNGMDSAAVEVKEGRLVVAYTYGSPQQRMFQSVDTREQVNSGDWHSVTLDLQNNVTVSLVSGACRLERCVQGFSYPKGKPVISSLTVRFGRFEESYRSQTLTGQMFVGCLEDVVVDSTYLYPGQPGMYLNAQSGCPRTPQCDPYTCTRHGTCTDLWDMFRCDCHRPYWGKNCNQTYTSATFSKGSVPSLAVFDLNNLTFTYGLDLSLFLQMRQAVNSIILYLSNSAASPSTWALSLETNNGRLAVRLTLCSSPEQYFNDPYIRVNQGWQNFVQLKLANSSLLALVNNSVVINQTVNMQSCPFPALKAYIGKAPETAASGRRKRQAPPPLSQLAPFDGVLQDLEMQNFKLDFAPRVGALEQSIIVAQKVNLTLGAESTVSVCNTSTPCANGGNCSDVFFNDFRCDCPAGYLGKNCSQPDFCKVDSCPLHTRCQSLQMGFECIGVGSFDGKTGSVQYTQSPPGWNLTNEAISFKFRTRVIFGAILEIRQRGSSFTLTFIKLRIRVGTLEVNYLLKDSGFSSSIRLHRLVNDGEWYSAEVSLAQAGSKNMVRLAIKDASDKILDEGQEDISIPVSSLSDLVSHGADIKVGGTLGDKEQAFQGCLEEVRLGGLLLPFLLDNKTVNNTAPQRFLADKIVNLPVDTNCPNLSDLCQSNEHLCVNDAVCEREWEGFSCNCSRGYQGDLCQQRTAQCPSSRCQSGGQCLEHLGYYTCQCPAGYTGASCETTQDYCANSTCANNSTCLRNTSVTRKYVCNCSLNYAGDLCNVSLINKTCADNLCQNGATCQNGTNGSAFTCNCKGGYTGTLCESTIDYCETSPCHNGTCVSNASIQNYTCTCFQGYMGVVCETNINECHSSPCHNGTCVDEVNGYHCDCNTGWTGELCERDVNECNANTCQHGYCNNTPGSYQCICNGTGFEGDNCTRDLDECSASYCPNATTASCTNSEGGYNCSCKTGYKGDNCTQATCEDRQCQNGAVCLNNVSAAWGTAWKCVCPKHYAGETCQLKGPCADSPCRAENTQECQQEDPLYQTNSSKYTCICKNNSNNTPGWQGQNCTEDIDECHPSNPCWNNAVCTNTNGSFNCTCSKGYNGNLCQTDIDECLSSPCVHGNCSQGIGNYSCDCSGTGYKGENCNVDINECEDNDTYCSHGNCTNNIGAPASCLCGKEYLGAHCEYVNPCNVTECGNGGSCNYTWVEAESKFTAVCSCAGGFSGLRCEQSPQKGDDINLGIIIGPIVGGILLIVIIVLIVFIMIARKKRATRGAYSPSRQETAGARVELGNVLKKPPEERLI